MASSMSEPTARWAPCPDTPTRSACARACVATLRWPVRQAEHAGRYMTRLRLTPLLTEHDGVECFDCVTERVGDFVIESCGGPLYWSQHHSPHRGVSAGAGWPVLLDEIGREIWLVQLWHSLDDVGLSEALRADMWRWAEPLSLHLLVPRARQAGVRRYPFERVRSWFTAASA